MIQADLGFSVATAFSKKDVPHLDLPESVQDLGINAHMGVIIVAEMFAGHDGNDLQDRLKSSEITWRLWNQVAGIIIPYCSQAVRGLTCPAVSDHADPTDLNYMLQRRIVNQETSNIITLAHLMFPDNVDQIPLGTDGQPLGPTAGHGKWYMPTASGILPETLLTLIFF